MFEFVYLVDFFFDLEDMGFTSNDCLFYVKAPSREDADVLISHLFAYNDYFCGATFMCTIDELNSEVH